MNTQYATRMAVLGIAAFLFNVSPVLRAEDEASDFGKHEFVYKSVGDLNILADVYRHDDQVKRPVIVWLHGGALLFGSRAGVPEQFKRLAETEGFILVSMDYRLAPEAQLSEIISDIVFSASVDFASKGSS